MIFCTQKQFDKAVAEQLIDAMRVLAISMDTNAALHAKLLKSMELTHAAVATNGFINDQLIKVRYALRDLITECESTDMIMLSESTAYLNAKDALLGPKKQ